MNTLGLVRVTVAAPSGRMDLALPQRSPIAEVLPGLLPGVDQQQGWVLRRMNGAPLDGAGTLAGNGVREGEQLQLTTARELADPIVRGGSGWSAKHRSRAVLGLAATAILLALVAVLFSGPPWTPAALWLLGAAVVLCTTGVLRARRGGDIATGAVLATLALPFAFAGGGLLSAGDKALSVLGAPQLFSGCVALVFAAFAGLIGVVYGAEVFTAALMFGLLGAIGAGLADAGLSGYGAAGIIAGAGLVIAPLLAPLSSALSRLALPVLPRGINAEPARSAIYAPVVRAELLHTGMLCGLACAAAGGELMLIRSGQLSAVILAGVLTIGFGLHARPAHTVAQRMALLLTSALGMVFLALGPLMLDRAHLLLIAGPVLLVFAALVVFFGLRDVDQLGSRLARYRQICEVIVVLAVIPVLCSVVGVYDLLRG